ncbi:MAG: tRNA 2-thiouridine(34) synthase MnmA [Bdellovibrionales bacterium]|nr:tRNA 2-thiouridine(34) synthase MnmA [Bdellovibrionales bacterium]
MNQVEGFIDRNPIGPDGRRRRVLVAMSGGVDSSVAAALLVEQGYDVVGVTMQVWDYTSCDIDEGNGTCCSSTDVDDARAVADRFGFPFYVANCEAKFKAAVIDPFVQGYLHGQTPLPCVNCNTFLKFDHLINRMRELDCDFLATGHYAKIEPGPDGRPTIVTSDDSWKDQTYFLFTIDPAVVPRLMFPIGHLNKPEVRAIAAEKGLLVARKKDSTGICFVGNMGYSNFIESQVDRSLLQPGNIRLHPTGEIVGTHKGIHGFTYGQRKGLGLATRAERSENEAPLFVLRIDPETRDVWVGEEKYLFSDRVTVKDPRFLGALQDGERLKVKIRYAHKGAYGRVFRREVGGETEVEVEFEEPVRAVTPGQAAVFYREAQLVGGGWIP